MMSKFNLFIIPRLGNKYEKYRLDSFIRIFELKNDIYYCFSHLDENKFRKKINLPNINCLYMKEYFMCKSWKESFEILDNIAKKIKLIIIMLNTLSKDIHLGNEHQIDKLYNSVKNNDQLFTNFVMLNMIYKYIFAIIYLARRYNIPVKHIIYDPQEFIFDTLVPKVSNYYFYDLEKNNSQYFPYVEYGFFYKKVEKFIYVKEYDFVFGTTAITKDRKWICDFIVNLSNKMKNKIKYKIYFKSNFTKHNNYIDYIDYIRMIKMARYTLVIPSYDKDEFSTTRFFEALAYDCIPLILHNVNFEKGLQHYKEITNIIKKYLIVTQNNILEKIEKLNYDFILNKIKETNDYKQLLDIDYYRRYVERCI